MAKGKRNTKSQGNKNPGFFKDTYKRKFYRENGRFVSEAIAKEKGISPEYRTVEVYRSKSGFVSKDKVKRSKKKVVNRYRIKGELKPIERRKITEKTLSKKDRPTFYRQEFWQSVKTNILKDIESKKVGVKVNGKIHEISSSDALKVGDFMTEVDYAIIKLFDEIGESPVMFIASAENETTVIYDFDEIAFNEALDEAFEDFPNEVNEFKRTFKNLKNRYF